MVIGNIVALHGKETGAGEFLVLDVLEAGLPPQIELPLKSSTMLFPPSLFFCVFFFFFAVKFLLGHLFLKSPSLYIKGLTLRIKQVHLVE